MTVKPLKSYIVVGTYALGVVLMAAVLLLIRGLDELLILLIVPILWAAFYYPRATSVTMTLALAAATVVVTRFLSPNFRGSMESTVVLGITTLSMCELLHQVAVSQRKAEQALRESADRFRLLYEQAPLAYQALDAHGCILAVNRIWCDTLGYSPEEVIGHPFAEFLDPSSRELRIAELGIGCEDRAGVEEYIMLRRNGERVLVNIIGQPAHDVQGRFVQIHCILHDVTEHKRTEERLRQAEKLAAIGQLAGGVAHDFNNLLTVINGYSQVMLAEMEPADPRREDMQTIVKAGERAAELTHQLLLFSRRQKHELRELDLTQILAGMTATLGRVIGENIVLRTDLASGLRPVQADAGQVEQMILNLAINARDAMPQGGELTVQTANVDLDASTADLLGASPGPYVMLVVTDTGEGMTAEVKEHLFEPFFSTKEVGKGTGLGLASIYGMVKQRGGHIEVESEPGRGATFRIYLPPADGVSEPVPAEKTDTAPQAGGETVLLVEDEEIVRKLVGRMLLRLGYSVLEAVHGAEAIEVARCHEAPIQLLLTDVVMPGINGNELAEQLQCSYAGLRVLLMSGYSDQGTTRQGSPDGEYPLIQKPFTIERLAETLRQVLDGPQLPGAPE